MSTTDATSRVYAAHEYGASEAYFDVMKSKLGQGGKFEFPQNRVRPKFCCPENFPLESDNSGYLVRFDAHFQRWGQHRQFDLTHGAWLPLYAKALATTTPFCQSPPRRSSSSGWRKRRIIRSPLRASVLPDRSAPQDSGYVRPPSTMCGQPEDMEAMTKPARFVA